MQNDKKKNQQLTGDSSIRVAVSLLDELMTLAGELVLSRNQLLQTIHSSDTRNAEAVGQRIDLITSELQEAIMLTRMQPIGNVFNKFPRIVRDLSKKLGRQIELTIVGQDVELDKTIIEAINDPLTHLVRNSVDHGIETPEQRDKKGKPNKGTIILKAFHEAGQVVIEITDDGKGIDGNLLVEVALQKGLITADQATSMSEKERTNLILMPGFSTAPKVTDVSGRGVGMDVVKTNLDKLGGSIEIKSMVDKGSTISIKLPLTLAIIPCQIVRTGKERYAIPQANLEELLRIPAAQVKKRVEKVGGAPVVRLRGNLLPLIKLSDILGIEGIYEDNKTREERLDRRKNIADRRSIHSPLVNSDTQELNDGELPSKDQKYRGGSERRYAAASTLNIVVVSTGAMKYGLIVDQLRDSEEIVIKPLGCHLQQCKGYAGATIMGDGQISLILDVGNLAKMAGLTSFDETDRGIAVATAEKDSIHNRKNQQALFTFRSSHQENFAIPLNQVERIEKVKSVDVELMGGKRVMQYRGGSLPLISVDEVATVQPLADQEDLLVIVFNIREHPIGLLATGPVDAVDLSVDIDEITLKQQGIKGSIIIKGQTTMMIDIVELVEVVRPEWGIGEAMSDISRSEPVSNVINQLRQE
jgi:two-component system, chemotaxis family, sensor kinase CheA